MTTQNVGTCKFTSLSSNTCYQNKCTRNEWIKLENAFRRKKLENVNIKLQEGNVQVQVQCNRNIIFKSWVNWQFCNKSFDKLFCSISRNKNILLNPIIILNITLETSQRCKTWYYRIISSSTGWPKMNEWVLIRYNFLFKT